MSIVPLSEMAVGESGRIKEVAGDTLISQYLLEMGLTPGSLVEVIRFAPMGDPIEIRIRGYYLSLRRSEARGVKVVTLQPEGHS